MIYGYAHNLEKIYFDEKLNNFEGKMWRFVVIRIRRKVKATTSLNQIINATLLVVVLLLYRHVIYNLLIAY